MKKTNPTDGHRIQVAIVESDPLRWAGFRALLESQSDLQLTSMALHEAAGAAAIDVLILNKRNSQNLSAMMQHLRMVRPTARVIVTAPGGNDEAVLEALADGVHGFVDEAAPAAEFVQAIRTVHQGLVWASRRVLAKFVDRSRASTKRSISRGDFTQRERQVLEMLVAGRSNKEIAAPLGIEERTVKAHVAKLMRKVGVQNRIMLSIHAVNHCLVSAR